MKNSIAQALKTVEDYCGASVFTNPKRFRAALADIRIEGEAKKVRNLLIVAVCEMRAYSRLEAALSTNPFIVDNLAAEMSSDFAIDKATAQTVIESVAQLLGYEPVQKETGARETPTAAREYFKKYSGIIAFNGDIAVGLQANGSPLAVIGEFSDAKVKNLKHAAGIITGWRDIAAVACHTSNYDNCRCIVGLKTDGAVVVCRYCKDSYAEQAHIDNYQDMASVPYELGSAILRLKDWTRLPPVSCNPEQNLRDTVAVAWGGGITLGLKKDGSVIEIGGLYHNSLHDRDVVALEVDSNSYIALHRDGTVSSNNPNGYNYFKDVSKWKLFDSKAT